VDVLDVLQCKSHFGATDPSDPRYDARHDLNVGSAINILDLLPFKPLSARVARRRPAPARHNIAPDPADRSVDITDISKMISFFGLSCT
jgi:hypothetical protein